MSKVRDFNLLKAGEVNATSTNTNSVSVVVNADTSGQSTSTNFQIPTPPITEQGGVIYPQSILPQEANVQVPPDYQQQIDSLQNELEFYKLLSSILSAVLKDNNPKLIINLIDMSGKIIIRGEDLIKLIAIKTKTHETDINLRYRDNEPGCIHKFSPIKTVEDIKINNESFNLRYNAEYNILKDDYNISLEKVIIV